MKGTSVLEVTPENRADYVTSSAVARRDVRTLTRRRWGQYVSNLRDLRKTGRGVEGAKREKQKRQSPTPT